MGCLQSRHQINEDTESGVSFQHRRRLSVVSHTSAINVEPCEYNRDTDELLLKKVLEEGVRDKRPEGATLKLHISSLSRAGFDGVRREKINQDACVTVSPYAGENNLSFFGVWDGHGAEGQRVSAFARHHIPRAIIETKDWKENNKCTAMVRGILKVDDDLREHSIPSATSGSTGVHAIVDTRALEIWCANVGDSRCVLGKKIGQKYLGVALSEDHKPDDKEEKKRIVKAKGRVDAWRSITGQKLGPARVWLRNQDIPGLAMSRSIGDFLAKSVGVIADADVTRTHLCPDHKFLILASDGVWEFISNDEACAIVAQQPSPQLACQALVEISQKRWRAEEDVVDDITAVVVFFEWGSGSSTSA